MPEDRKAARSARREARRKEFNDLMRSLSAPEPPFVPATPLPPPDPTLWERSKKFAPTAVRGIGGLLGVTPVTGAIGGGVSELAAEALEGRFAPKEIATAAGLGLLGGGAVRTLLKNVGAPLTAAARTVPWAAAQPVVRSLSEEGELPEAGEVATSVGLQAGVAGGLSKLLGTLGVGKIGKIGLETAPPAAKAVPPAPPVPKGPALLTNAAGDVVRVKDVPLTPTGPITGTPSDISKTIAPLIRGPIEKASNLARKETRSALEKALVPEREPAGIRASRTEATRVQRAEEAADREALRLAAAEEKSAAKAVDDAAARHRIDEAKSQGMTPAPPSVSETVSARIPGGTERLTQKYRFPEEQVDEGVEALGNTLGVTPPPPPRGVPSALQTEVSEEVAKELPLAPRGVTSDTEAAAEAITKTPGQPAVPTEPIPAQNRAQPDIIPETQAPPITPPVPETTPPFLGGQAEAVGGAETTIPLSAIRRAPVDIAGEHYRELQGLLKGPGQQVGALGPVTGEGLEKGTRTAGRALQREAAQAGLPTRGAAQVAPTAPVSPPAGIPGAPATSPTGLSFEDMMKRVQTLGRRPGGAGRYGEERGAVTPELAARLGLGVSGAVLGAALSPDEDRMIGAAIGAVAGSSLPLLLSKMSPAAIKALPPSVISDATPEGQKTALETITRMFPNLIRFNLLSSPNLFNNAIAGPWGAGKMAGLELHLAGDPRGRVVLEGMRPENWASEFIKSWPEAKTIIGAAERHEGLSIAEAPTLLEQFLAVPGTFLSMGDITTRRILTQAGLTEAEARMVTLTSEPELGLTKGIVNLQRSGGIVGHSLLPFARTLANVVEQGGYRTPGLGPILQSYRTNPAPAKLQAMQQLLGGATIAGSGVAGAAIPAGLEAAGISPDNERLLERTLRSGVTNVAGPYALLAAMGYAGGKALGQGEPARVAASTAMTEGMRSLPLPSTDIPESYKQFFLGSRTQEPFQNIPAGSLPTFAVELLRRAEPGRRPQLPRRPQRHTRKER